MNVGQLISKDLVSLPSSSTMRDVAKAMRDNDVSSVILLGEGGEVTIVTERDVTRAVAEGLDYSTPAKKLGKGPVISIEKNRPLIEALELMGEKKIRHLLVTDRGKPVGVVSIREVANTLSLMMVSETSY
ncbi:CBS domain-containing protein [Metallosphaera tengchongensis]|uniref:CBS domain-containing protein n=1 Tax=Metallosphaera tengchongensis TaxID=1532350 RepID=A0A6N0NVE4_9CREN|nr:CBS domain-containing protein [Metallosphaera tengchongensis]QKR00702.1 CBS domain-containing protein [Metallosphaera tengchongensis]